MNKTQKSAWGGLVLVAFLSMIPVIDIIEKSLGLLLTHLVGYSLMLPPFILIIYLINKINTQSGVTLDERDKFIIKRSLIVAFTTVSAIAITSYVVAFLSIGETGVISVSKLPVFIYIAFIIFILILSVSVLIQYSRGAKDD